MTSPEERQIAVLIRCRWATAFPNRLWRLEPVGALEDRSDLTLVGCSVRSDTAADAVYVPLPHATLDRPSAPSRRRRPGCTGGAKRSLRKRCFSVARAATHGTPSCSAFGPPPTRWRASPATFVSSPTRPRRAATRSTRLASSHPEVRFDRSPRPKGSSSTSGSILVANSGFDRPCGTAIELRSTASTASAVSHRCGRGARLGAAHGKREGSRRRLNAPALVSLSDPRAVHGA